MIRLIRQLFSNPFDYANRFAAARRITYLMRYLPLLVFLPVVGCAIFIAPPPSSLPHRADWEMYSIQGHATDSHCDGPDIVKHMPMYVYSDDGTPLFLECVGDRYEDEDPDGLPGQLDRMVKTDRVWTVILPEMTAMWAMVPHVTAGVAVICFRAKGQVALDCFYRNEETGQTIIRHVESNLTGI